MGNLSYFNYDNIKDQITNNELYVTLGNISNTNISTEQGIKEGFIFGKKVKSSDFTGLIDKIDWTSGTIYNPWYKGVNYFIINSNNDVFKCISNNDDAVSTAEPLTKSNSIITTADGYKWKYMFTAASSDILKFSYAGKFPITSNNSVVANSINGTIDHVAVANTGTNYIAYNAGQISSVIANNLFQISNTASQVTDIYAGSAIYAIYGTGAGTLATISNSYSNTLGRYITLTSNVTFSTDTNYIISPKVNISDRFGTGFSAYSTVDAVNGIDKIIILNSGSNYRSPVITISSAVGSGATITPYVSPFGGHGSNPFNELNSNSAIISVNFLNSEDTTLPTDLTFYSSSLVSQPSVNIAAQNTISYGISCNVSSTFTISDVVIGQTSNATGIVYYSNTSHIKVFDINGTFLTNEIVTNQIGVNSAINIIKSTDVISESGTIIKYNTHSAGINRTTNVSENIKFIFKI